MPNMGLPGNMRFDYLRWAATLLRRAVHRHGQCGTNLSHPLVCQPSNPFDENGN